MTILASLPIGYVHRHPAVIITPGDKQSYFSGNGFFAGTVTRQNRPVQATIQLIHSETGTIVRTTMSEVDGTFMFQNVAEDHEYHIVAIDPEGEWEHKVSSRRYPRTTL